MKKLFFFLSAIALLGLTSACVEQLQVNNPNYNAERGEVKTDFTINIAGPVATKATAATAQTNDEDNPLTGAFRGMSDMTLFVLKGDPAATTNAADFESTNYPLGTLGTTDISATKSSKIYNLTFPTGVKNMVFYAKATYTGSDNAANGKIAWPSMSNGTTKNGVVFGLTPIASATTAFNGEATKIAEVLNAVVTAFGDDVTAQGYDANLKKAYELFTTIGNSELRLGSAPAVKRMLTDLQKTVTNLKVGASQEVAGICDAILRAIGTPGTINGVQSNFPADLGLPEGAAQLAFGVNPNADQTGAKKNEFYYVTTRGAVANTTASDITKFTYPVELCYWVSSTIRTSTDPDITEATYPKNVTDWSNWKIGTTDVEGNWVENGTITSATRAVALKENIQYANALMKTTIAYKSGVSQLQDNNSRINAGEQNNSINIPTTTVNNSPEPTFIVKGILVGKQPTKVGWNFRDAVAATQEGGNTIPGTSWDGVIYDTVFDKPEGESDIAIPTTKPLYTMVFDNSANTEDKVVNIAIEFVNNSGTDFWGRDNLIPAGGTFYLAAQLDLTKVESAKTNSIFAQDYVTSVNLTLDKFALQNAYATVPDLRSVAMTFGLSVDLTWQAGNTHSIELGTTGNTGN